MSGMPGNHSHYIKAFGLKQRAESPCLKASMCIKRHTVGPFRGWGGVFECPNVISLFLSMPENREFVPRQGVLLVLLGALVASRANGQHNQLRLFSIHPSALGTLQGAHNHMSKAIYSGYRKSQ